MLSIIFGGDVIDNFVFCSVFWLMFIIHIKD